MPTVGRPLSVQLSSPKRVHRVPPQKSSKLLYSPSQRKQPQCHHSAHTHTSNALVPITNRHPTNCHNSNHGRRHSQVQKQSRVRKMTRRKRRKDRHLTLELREPTIAYILWSTFFTARTVTRSAVQNVCWTRL